MAKQYTLIASDGDLKIEVCVMPSLIEGKGIETSISTYDEESGELTQEITLSVEQAEVVRKHLSCTTVQNIFFGEEG
jgi:hypothetical protein